MQHLGLWDERVRDTPNSLFNKIAEKDNPKIMTLNALSKFLNKNWPKRHKRGEAQEVVLW